MRVLQINTNIASGSTGKIAESLGKFLLSQGHTSYIGYGRGNKSSTSNIIKIGNNFDNALHLIKSRLFDRHCFGSANATRNFLKAIDNIQPDIIHLQNLHGYYINIEILFEYLAEKKIPVIWTLHDCWSFTGHCCFFDSVNCYKWERECSKCPNLKGYPRSWLIDNSRNNFIEKRNLINRIQNLTFVVPSIWLKSHVQNSFLKGHRIELIRNGIDIEVFKPLDSKIAKSKYNLKSDYLILGVANKWDKRKGLSDFISLLGRLDKRFEILLVGLSKGQIKELPEGIRGIMKTENINELVELYSAADVFVNPTYADNFPTTNIEALASGTPVVTYRTGGSPEAIDYETGIVVEKGSIDELYNAIVALSDYKRGTDKSLCRNRVIEQFNSKNIYWEYLSLYSSILLK